MVRQKVSLRHLLPDASFVDCGDIVCQRAASSSCDVQPGYLFVALPGSRLNGHQFASEAVGRGAGAVLVDHPIPALGVPQCVVADTRSAWAVICMAQHEVSVDEFTFSGVTGTNGKTTTTWLLRAILSQQQPTGLIGTIEYHDGRTSQSANLTTPDPSTLSRLLARMKSANTQFCVMELSSHALDQRRCDGIRLAAAAVTNVTQDHFDYHGTMDNYLRSKQRIAELLNAGRSLLLCHDDEGCQALRLRLPKNTLITSYGFSRDADLQVVTDHTDAAGRMHVTLKLESGELSVRTQLAGQHNALNCLAAAAMAEQLGISHDHIVRGIESVSHVPGRMERIDAGQPFQVFVDFAHTPDGLRHCIRTVRAMTPGRVICLFGAGGDRDKSKRPLMAKAAEEADLIVLTSDNPRSEPPERIIDEITSGFTDITKVARDVDRASAIARALQLAQPGDSVIVAGRGHETSQQVGTRVISFDDRRVVRRVLKQLLPQFERASHADSSQPLPIGRMPAA